ncbi:MAG TPA: hypothetical protein VD886_07235 [Herpetosiphonaceae bacterium]|nr:hypothetical protein [Herpetosiphonaceae bacterium]
MSYLLPLGPFHPAWRGPLRMVLRVEGERIADVEYRDGYGERGISERLTRSSIPQAIHLVSHICAVDSQAHTLAFCQALEGLLKLKVPARAAALRVAAAEVERGIAHLGALADVIYTLGLERDAAYVGKLHHGLVEVQHHLCGATVQPNYHVPGGVRQDLGGPARESMLLHLRRIERLMYRFVDRFIDHRGVLRRTVGFGILGKEAAEQFGVRGPLARATGIPYDARLDRPYAAYGQWVPNRVVQERGDVYSRLVVLVLEAFEGVKIAVKVLSDLPGGEWAGNAPETVPAGTGSAAVESARGTLRYSVQSNGVKLTSVRIDAPRQFDRLIARTMLAGMNVDDAALIIASAAPCVACSEG